MYYNYYDAMKTDIIEALEDDELFREYAAEATGLDNFYNLLEDYFFIDDGVTGNASGSYTFNSHEAMEYVTDNLDILENAYSDFGTGYEEIGKDFMDQNFEAMDVTIRCYLLPTVLWDVVQGMKKDFEAFKEEQEEQEEEE